VLSQIFKVICIGANYFVEFIEIFIIHNKKKTVMETKMNRRNNWTIMMKIIPLFFENKKGLRCMNY